MRDVLEDVAAGRSEPMFGPMAATWALAMIDEAAGLLKESMPVGTVSRRAELRAQRADWAQRAAHIALTLAQEE